MKKRLFQTFITTIIIASAAFCTSVLYKNLDMDHKAQELFPYTDHMNAPTFQEKALIVRETLQAFQKNGVNVNSSEKTKYASNFLTEISKALENKDNAGLFLLDLGSLDRKINNQFMVLRESYFERNELETFFAISLFFALFVIFLIFAIVYL
jgi:hypothetical protein